jgi:hypothetical protein
MQLVELVKNTILIADSLREFIYDGDVHYSVYEHSGLEDK